MFLHDVVFDDSDETLGFQMAGILALRPIPPSHTFRRYLVEDSLKPLHSIRVRIDHFEAMMSVLMETMHRDNLFQDLPRGGKKKYEWNKDRLFPNKSFKETKKGALQGMTLSPIPEMRPADVIDRDIISEMRFGL